MNKTSSLLAVILVLLLSSLACGSAIPSGAADTSGIETQTALQATLVAIGVQQTTMAQQQTFANASPTAWPSTATEQPTEELPTDTPLPTATFTSLPTYTPHPTYTPRPTYTPFPTLTPTPGKPKIEAQSGANVRTCASPDCDPPIGWMDAGDDALILGRNPACTWWLVQLSGGVTGWVWQGNVTPFNGANCDNTPIFIPPTITPVPPTQPPAPTTPIYEIPGHNLLKGDRKLPWSGGVRLYGNNPNELFSVYYVGGYLHVQNETSIVLKITHCGDNEGNGKLDLIRIYHPTIRDHFIYEQRNCNGDLEVTIPTVGPGYYWLYIIDVDTGPYPRKDNDEGNGIGLDVDGLVDEFLYLLPPY